MKTNFNPNVKNTNFGANLRVKNNSCWNAIRKFHDETELAFRVQSLHEAFDDFKKFRPGKIYEVMFEETNSRYVHDFANHSRFVFTCEGETVFDKEGYNFIEALSCVMGKAPNYYFDHNKKMGSFDVFV